MVNSNFEQSFILLSKSARSKHIAAGLHNRARKLKTSTFKCNESQIPTIDADELAFAEQLAHFDDFLENEDLDVLLSLKAF